MLENLRYFKNCVNKSSVNFKTNIGIHNTAVPRNCAKQSVKNVTFGVLLEPNASCFFKIVFRGHSKTIQLLSQIYIGIYTEYG
jgi:hypothetical protein